MVLGFTGNGLGAAKPDLAPLQQLRGYWEALRVGGRLPQRAQIDPRGIAGALEHSFILDRIAPGIAKFRLCGMGVGDIMGMEPAGMPLSVLFDPAGRSRLALALEQVFAAPSVLELWLEAERGLGKPALCGRMLILPLLDGVGEVCMALGGLVTAGAVGRQPRRFAIASALSEPLVSLEPVQCGISLQEFAEAPAEFQPERRGTRPHLRLVSSRG